MGIPKIRGGGCMGRRPGLHFLLISGGNEMARALNRNRERERERERRGWCKWVNFYFYREPFAW
jgi:hypothetical protein